MLLNLEGARDRGEPIEDLLCDRGYGGNGRHLSREFRDRLPDDDAPAAGSPRIGPGRPGSGRVSSPGSRTVSARMSSSGRSSVGSRAP